MSKISKYKKDRMVREIIRRQFDNKIEAVKLKISNRCVEIISDELKGIPTKACDKFIKNSEYVYLSDTDFKYRGRSENFVLPAKLPRPAEDNWHFNVENHPILKRLFNEYFLLKDQVSDAKDVLWAVMNSCNTTKQLIDSLPEIEPIMKDLFDERADVSIVAVETINKARILLSGDK